MKLAKRLATFILSICLIVPCFSMMAFAANGEISFNDPKAEVGEEVLIRVTTKVDAGVSNLKYTISYDPQVLEYKSATNVTKVSDGTLVYEYHMNTNSLAEGYDVYIKFTALKDAATEVTISSNDIVSDYDITWVHGKSVVTIGSGEAVPETETPETETPETEAPETETPETETPDTEKPEGQTGGNVVISNVTTIILQKEVGSIVLPEQYKSATVTMDGVEYPAWRDSDNHDMYILYAVSETTGQPSLYQYDTLENTYQRFEMPEQVEEVEPEEPMVEDSLATLFGEYTKYVYIGTAALLVVLIILVIVLGIKLSNRNSELDEVYDEMDELLAEREKTESTKTSQEFVAAMPVETQDDVILTPEDVEDQEEDDPEVEVEFYVEEAIKEFFTEEATEENAESVVDEPQEASKPVVEEVSLKEAVVPLEETEEYYDDDDKFYDDLESHFSVNFIDLDD